MTTAAATVALITLHPASKPVAGGFVPMITLRGAKGRMIGSRTPEGGYREFRTFTNEAAALEEAKAIAARCVAAYPRQLRASH